MAVTCEVCGAKVADGLVLCSECVAVLLGWVHELGWLKGQLIVTITRQDKFGAQWSGGGKSSERPLPFNDAASRVGDDLTVTFNRWAPVLYSNVSVHPDSPAAFRDIERVVKRARNAIDRPPDRVFAGRCESEVVAGGNVGVCTEDLYAMPGKGTVRCRVCGTEHDVTERRDWMLSQLRGQAADAGLMSSILVQLGFKIASSTIRRYGAEGLLTVVSRDSRGVPRYSIGQVLEVFVERKSRRGRKKSKKIA